MQVTRRQRRGSQVSASEGLAGEVQREPGDRVIMTGKGKESFQKGGVGQMLNTTDDWRKTFLVHGL